MKPAIRAACLTFMAMGLATPGTMLAQSPPQTARPIPPRLPLTVRALRCEYGGAVPAISVMFEASSTTALTHVRATSLLIGNSRVGWAMGNDGALSTRAWNGIPGTPTATPLAFDGSIPTGATIQLQVFARLAFTAFGSGVTYPNRELGFRLVLEADQGVLEITGPRCTITPAG